MAWTLVEADSPEQFAAAGSLFREYAGQLGVDLCFQGFEAELLQLAQMYGAPHGCLVLAMRGGRATACGALRPLGELDCEMKRLYVRSDERKAGLGRSIAQRLIERAVRLGYRTMYLDTLAQMTAARGLYESLGFRGCGPYYENPLPDAVYMRLDLGAGPRS